MMKKLLSFVFYSVLALSLTLECAHAMKRAAEDDNAPKYETRKKREEPKLEDLVQWVPEEVWLKILSYEPTTLKTK